MAAAVVLENFGEKDEELEVGETVVVALAVIVELSTEGNDDFVIVAVAAVVVGSDEKK